jgi:hypothetical protein
LIPLDDHLDTVFFAQSIAISYNHSTLFQQDWSVVPSPALRLRAFVSVALASLPAIAPRRPPLLPLADPRFKVIGCVAKKSLGDQIGRAFEPLL